VRGNRLFADGDTKPLVGIARQKQSTELMVEDNATAGYLEPPTVEEVTQAK
jgi:hypothetical protein